ncbi:MAG TPA: Uma2 family endonuclease [Paraburkholderia sp.]|uniref:Uma2 family endonuclease n=1 Tax=Paraburkholderia sp. TaxID=1926495 RepID=UPI002ED009C1
MHAKDRLPASELLARWRALQNGDLAIETNWYELNERGDIVVTPPPTNRHQAIAGNIAFQLSSQLGLLAVQSAPVVTSAGILVPDVAWMPEERWRAAIECGDDPLPLAPNICVEVLSPCNHNLEMSRKIRAYLEGGSKEVILVGMQGKVRFYREGGESSTSSLGLSLVVEQLLVSASEKNRFNGPR